MLLARLVEVCGTLLTFIVVLIQLTAGTVNGAALGAFVPLPRIGTWTIPCSTCKSAPLLATDNAVKIEFEGHGAGFRILGLSQGTVLDGNTLLTHHHFEPALESLSSLVFTLTDVKGNQFHATVDIGQIRALDSGSTLIPLPELAQWERTPPTVHANALSLQKGDTVSGITFEYCFKKKTSLLCWRLLHFGGVVPSIQRNLGFHLV